MTNKKEVMVLPFEFKSVGDPDADGYVEFTGYAAVKNNVDLGYDIIADGAFVDTIKNDGSIWPILLDHQAYMRETAGYNKVAFEDENGLKVTGQLNTNIEAGRIAHELSKQAFKLGKQIGLSIGYGIIDKEYRNDIRILKTIKMYEYSFTNFPMNPAATVTAMKDMESAREALFKAAVKEYLAENKDFLLKTIDTCDSVTTEIDDDERKALIEGINQLTKNMR